MAEPIIRVEGPDGELWHDCLAAGCEVSWDGFVIGTDQRIVTVIGSEFNMDMHADAALEALG